MKRIVWLLILSLFALPLAAQEAKAPEKKPVDWSFSGEIRFRPEYRDNADLNSDANDDLRQGFMRLRLGVAATFQEDYRLFVQAQDSRVAGEEVSTASNEKNLDLHQGYVEIAKLGAERLALTLGRQEWKYGDERMIGAYGWNNVGRSFDGVKLRWSGEKYWLDGLFAEVTSRVTAGATTGSELVGAYYHVAPKAGSEFEGYTLGYFDHTDAAGETGALGQTHVIAVGGRAKSKAGGFDYLAEAAVERGEIRGDDLSAVAAGGQGGWTWGGEWKLRAFGGYDYATGDKDPTDGKQEEFFNFFPTNHPLYGYEDYFGWRNLKSPYAGASFSRGKHFVLLKGHLFSLEQARGPWKDAAGNVMGFDPAGASGTKVGNEIDLLYRYALKEKAALEAGVSRFAPDEFAKNTRGSDASPWGYVQLTVGF
jgi:alginate export protein